MASTMTHMDPVRPASGFAAFLPSSPDDGQQAQSPRPRQQAPSQAQQASDRQQPIGVD